MRFFDYGASNTTDAFRFSVSDGAGGLAAGTFVISALVSVNAPISQLEFSLAPNPASESVRLAFGTGLNSDASVTITDISGRTLRSFVLATGVINRELDIRNLPSGTYLLSVQNAEGIATKKLIVR